jgi:hypothetical protein
MNLKDLRFKFDKLTPKQKSLFYSALSDQERVMIAKSWALTGLLYLVEDMERQGLGLKPHLIT